MGSHLWPGAGPAQFPDLTPGLRLLATATGCDIDGTAQIKDHHNDAYSSRCRGAACGKQNEKCCHVGRGTTCKHGHRVARTS